MGQSLVFSREAGDESAHHQEQGIESSMPNFQEHASGAGRSARLPSWQVVQKNPAIAWWCLLFVVPCRGLQPYQGEDPRGIGHERLPVQDGPRGAGWVSGYITGAHGSATG